MTLLCNLCFPCSIYVKVIGTSSQAKLSQHKQHSTNNVRLLGSKSMLCFLIMNIFTLFISAAAANQHFCRPRMCQGCYLNSNKPRTRSHIFGHSFFFFFGESPSSYGPVDHPQGTNQNAYTVHTPTLSLVNFVVPQLTVIARKKQRNLREYNYSKPE